MLAHSWILSWSLFFISTLHYVNSFLSHGIPTTIQFPQRIAIIAPPTQRQLEQWQQQLHYPLTTKVWLQMDFLTIPLQEDLTNYERVVKERIGEEALIRWYVAEMTDQVAFIEAVYDEKKLTHPLSPLLPLEPTTLPSDTVILTEIDDTKSHNHPL